MMCEPSSVSMARNFSIELISSGCSRLLSSRKYTSPILRALIQCRPLMPSRPLRKALGAELSSFLLTRQPQTSRLLASCSEAPPLRASSQLQLRPLSCSASMTTLTSQSPPNRCLWGLMRAVVRVRQMRSKWWGWQALLPRRLLTACSPHSLLKLPWRQKYTCSLIQCRKMQHHCRPSCDRVSRNTRSMFSRSRRTSSRIASSAFAVARNWMRLDCASGALRLVALRLCASLSRFSTSSVQLRVRCSSLPRASRSAKCCSSCCSCLPSASLWRWSSLRKFSICLRSSMSSPSATRLFFSRLYSRSRSSRSYSTCSFSRKASATASQQPQMSARASAGCSGSEESTRAKMRSSSSLSWLSRSSAKLLSSMCPSLSLSTLSSCARRPHSCSCARCSRFSRFSTPTSPSSALPLASRRCSSSLRQLISARSSPSLRLCSRSSARRCPPSFSIRRASSLLRLTATIRQRSSCPNTHLASSMRSPPAASPLGSSNSAPRSMPTRATSRISPWMPSAKARRSLSFACASWAVASSPASLLSAYLRWAYCWARAQRYKC